LNISELTRRAIQTISKNGDTITPLLFFDTFCGEARRNRVVVEDCELIKQYIEKLDPEFRNEANRYNIRNIREFLSYLTSALNRMNQNHLANRHNSLFALSKKIVEAVALIDNQELENLSGRTDALLKRVHTPENLDEMRREWARFAFEYKKDRNRKKLSQFVQVDSNDDLDTIIDKVVPLLEREKMLRNGGKIVDLVVQSATPSLARVQDKTLSKLYKELKAEPDRIYQPEIQERIEKLQDNRVDIDRAEEKESIKEAQKLVEALVDEVGEQETQKDIDLEERVNKLKEDIRQAKESGDTSTIIEKVESGLEGISKQTSGLLSSLKKYSSGIFDIKNRIDKLEEELSNKRAEADRDLLTNMKNRRGFDRDLEAIEKEFQEKKQENYSVVVIDIDGFKKITDKYGNDAGDLILRYFSKVLKEYISIGDSTARYGEDRFLVSLPNRSLGEAIQFVQKFQEKVKHTKFVYKSERVVVTFSAGITDRKGVDNIADIVDEAYKMLKEAKKRGGNRIYPEYV